MIRPFYKSWTLILLSDSPNEALFVNFLVLSSRNGFKRIGEISLTYFLKGREVFKNQLRQSLDMTDALISTATHLELGASKLTLRGSKGRIESKEGMAQWNFEFELDPFRPESFIPKTLRRFMKQYTFDEAYRFSVIGSTEGPNYSSKSLNYGIYRSYSGPKNLHSWIWGFCDHFLDEKNDPADFCFEGIRYKRRVSRFPSPPSLHLCFRYRGEVYRFSGLHDFLHVRSGHSLNDWEFQAERKGLRFQGKGRAAHKDLAGRVFEDTDGSLLYSTFTGLADFEILVYRSGKLEATFTALSRGCLEWVSRTKNPYVHLSA